MTAAITPSDVLREHDRSGTWTGSWLAAYASGEPIVAGMVKTREGAACAACGHRFLPGERGHENLTQGSTTFNDAYSMCGKAADPICSACAAIWNRRFLLDLSKCIVTTEGVWAIASNDDRAWFLRNPPKPPFVMVCGLAKQQHLYWRTPVCWSTELITLRVGTHVGTVRRQLVLDALPLGVQVLEKARAFAERRAAQDAKAGGSVKQRRASKSTPARAATGAIPHVFVRLDRELLSTSHLTLKASVRDYLASDEATTAERQLGELNPIEGWALAALVNPKRSRSEPPVPLATPRQPRII